jgi:hypothetical protein
MNRTVTLYRPSAFAPSTAKMSYNDEQYSQGGGEYDEGRHFEEDLVVVHSHTLA